MQSIYELVDSNAMAEYIVKIQSNAIPYLGEALFPNDKKQGLNLEWIVGYNSLPVALMPSAFDAKPTLRDRIGAASVQTEMPFFRESMRIGEKDRQNLLMFLEANKSQYAYNTIMKIFDDVNNLVEGAKVQTERERMSLLTTGAIDITAPDEKGVSVSYAYNYDKSGKWAKSNKTKVAKSWSDPESTPIQDIQTIITTAANHGVVIKRAILSTKTWSYLAQNASIKNDMNVTEGQKIILTDNMLKTYLVNKLGITFVTYDKMYKDEAGADKAFFPDDQVTFIPEGTLGKTWYGTTPEEADLMSGNTNASVSIVNTGVAVTTIKEAVPVNVVTVVSQIALPSFERMADVYNLITKA